MIDRDSQRQIEALWRLSKTTTATSAQRLEAMIDAYLVMMRAVADGIVAVQQYWDNAGMLALLAAAESGQPLDAGGRVAKESIQEYQVLFLAFRAWLAAPTEATFAGQTITLEKTLLQLITQQPVLASTAQNEGEE
jgi:hypothetical protein